MNLRKWLIGDFSARRVSTSIVEIYLGLLVWAFFFSDRMIFQPPPPGYTEDEEVYRIPVGQSDRIAICAVTNPQARYVILHMHGNAEDIGTVRYLLEEFRANGFSAYTFDYPGYGLSDGRPSTRRAYAAAETVFRHLVEDRKIAPSNIILHGRSVGAAFAIHLAARQNVAALILESGFVTAFRALTQIPVAPFDKMRNNREIRKVRCPVLVIHGETDETIPTWQGKRLFALAHEPKLAYWVPGASHDDVLVRNETEYWAQVHKLMAYIP